MIRESQNISSILHNVVKEIKLVADPFQDTAITSQHFLVDVVFKALYISNLPLLSDGKCTIPRFFFLMGQKTQFIGCLREGPNK